MEQQKNFVDHWIRQKLFSYKDIENNVLIEVHTGGGSSKDEHYGVTYFPLRTTISMRNLRATSTYKCQIVLQYELLNSLVSKATEFVKTLGMEDNCYVTKGPSSYQIHMYEHNGNKKTLQMGVVPKSQKFFIQILDPVSSSQPYTGMMPLETYKAMNSLLRQVIENYAVLSSNNIIALTNCEVGDMIKQFHSHTIQTMQTMQSSLSDLRVKTGLLATHQATQMTNPDSPYVLVGQIVDPDKEDENDITIDVNYASAFSAEMDATNGFHNIELDIDKSDKQSTPKKHKLNGDSPFIEKYLNYDMGNLHTHMAAFMSSENFDVFQDIISIGSIVQHEVDFLKGSMGFDETIYLINNIIKQTVKQSIQQGNWKIYRSPAPKIKFNCEIDTMNTPHFYRLSQEMFVVMIMQMHYVNEIVKVEDKQPELIEYHLYQEMISYILKMICSCFFFSVSSFDRVVLDTLFVEISKTEFMNSLSQKLEYLSGNRYKWLMTVENFNNYMNQFLESLKKLNPGDIKSSGLFDEFYEKYPEIERIHSKKSDVVIPTLEEPQDKSKKTYVDHEEAAAALATDLDPIDMSAYTFQNNDKNTGMLDWGNEEPQEVQKEETIADRLDLYKRIVHDDAAIDEQSKAVVAKLESYESIPIVFNNHVVHDRCIIVKRLMDQYPTLTMKIDIIKLMENFSEDLQVTRSRVLQQEESIQSEDSEDMSKLMDELGF